MFRSRSETERTPPGAESREVPPGGVSASDTSIGKGAIGEELQGSDSGPSDVNIESLQLIEDAPSEVAEYSGAIAAPKRTACDVIVAGGSTAGVAAAIAAAREFEALGSSAGRKRVVCLLEPTDWVGGQLAASGVPAVDFAWHKVPDAGMQLNLSRLTRDVSNGSRTFVDWLNAIAPASNGRFESFNNPGKCWVSARCYEPLRLVDVIRSHLAGLESKGHLRVFWNTVPKRVGREGRMLKSIEAVRRTPKDVADPRNFIWNRRLSSVLADWYSPRESSIYAKETLIFEGVSENGATIFPMVVDGTEWGELLVLSGASYMQGVEASEANPAATNESCGQAIVYPVSIELRPTDASLPPWFASIESKIRYPKAYALNEPGKSFSWDDVWSYRRLRSGKCAPGSTHGVPIAGVGDISSQNWVSGNDYPFRYLFLSRSASALQLSDWKGGVDVTALDEAEMHALGWFRFLRQNAPRGLGSRLALTTVFGTASGFSKMPYIRDTRRSVGLNDFVLKYEGGVLEGTRYDDTIAIGAYAADVHFMKNAGCSIPAHVARLAVSHPRPFYLPFRAHTNKDFDNLMVSGKLMAQTFAANAATRVHPIEFASGTGAGAAAAFMQRWQIGTGYVVSRPEAMRDIQARIRALHGPLEFQNLASARE